MNQTTTTFDPSELCSRKLWELVSGRDRRGNEQELQQAVRELAARRSYLQELQNLGKLEQH